MRMLLSGKGAAAQHVPSKEWQRFNAPESFRRAISAIVVPGTTVVITADSLREGATGAELTVIETERAKQ